MNEPQTSILNRLLEMGRRAVNVFRSPQTPLYVKLLLGAGLIYILSPWDIIPEWVPVVGILDDIALAAILVAWAAGYQDNQNR